MFSISGLPRAIALIFVCLFVVACNQTASSTYNGSIGENGFTSADIRKKKIAAARERARKARIAKREAFKAKREQARSERRAGKNANKDGKTRRTSLFSRSKSKKAKATSRKRKASARKRKVRLARVTKGRKQRIKRKSKAFVPSVSRRAGRLRVNAPWKCVPARLKRVITQVRKRWGPVTINSTYRSRRHNRMVGGKRRSFHLRCRAIDFRVNGSSRGLLAWLRRHPSVGGYKRYRTGFFHIDTGPKRTW